MHAATLLGTGWLLIATSAPQESPSVPARDCYKGIPSPAALLVTLGNPASTEGGLDPSCAGIDGLAPGVALLFDVVQGARSVEYTATCFGFQTTGLQGVSGVTLGAQAPPTGGSLTTASGPFMPASEQGCTGSWSLDLEPTAPVPDGGLLSPLDAGEGSWLVLRTITMPQAQFCGDALPARGPLTCTDTFVVQSITLSGEP